MFNLLPRGSYSRPAVPVGVIRPPKASKPFFPEEVTTQNSDYGKYTNNPMIFTELPSLGRVRSVLAPR
jgi:hypothetical protein